ncbi:glycosyltransferase involved in cell wall biosynthesis [Bradyrhizobium macuxiense]|uniref:Glycosyltransferase involved in cell wall biosynthesis n=1 Tax=Bradyrhizobium macuxiense TaxID=1755647 RepID=A0A560L332_9BRAD|nr:glycosyltransferase [Bradyrhizobium macuxiense]TWB87540.1 glycosyltransferase involved in cell wall biosynthesis [Bradyrhizobium macuxiense]
MLHAPVELVVLVLPCLNEEKTLAATCNSLGFGLDGQNQPANAVLVMVDNGSVDDTPNIMSQIRFRSPAHTVIIRHEAERGYVPPRRAGIAFAQEIAQERHVSDQKTLIVQVDADTEYCPFYADLLRAAADRVGENVMLEGLSLRPLDFPARYPAYVGAVEQTDRPLFPHMVDEAHDILIDDKLSSFRLSDYFLWGGLHREYLPSGLEIHAETSRLYIRARFRKARKEFIAQAYARPSHRRLLEDPLAIFASAGFPREPGWDTWWRVGAAPQDAASIDLSQPIWKSAVALRRAHQLLLQAALPLHVCRLTDKASNLGAQFARFESILEHFDDLTANSLLEHPGLLFARGFELLDSERSVERLNALVVN